MRKIVVNGYITDAEGSTLNATLPYLTFLSPFSYRSDILGNLTPTFNLDITLSVGQRTANLLTLTNLLDAGGFSSQTAHDYAAHGQTVDCVVLMTYEWGYTYGPAMAVAPLNKVRQVPDYAVQVMPASASGI